MQTQHSATAADVQQQYGMYILQRIEARQGFNARSRAVIFSEPVTRDETHDCTPLVAVRRLLLPYTQSADDRFEYLFNREYNPLWKRPHGGGTVTRAPAVSWTRGDNVWFYNDGTLEPERIAAARQVCAEWGISLPRKLTDLIVLA